MQAPETVGNATLASMDGCQTETVGGNRRCVLTLTAPRTVRARYTTPDPVTLTATRQGDGTLTATPAGGPLSSCDPMCTVEVRTGTPVTLRAAPGPDNEIVGWTGVQGCGAGATTCSFTVTADMAVTVQFATVSQLTVLIEGQGMGRVSGEGLSCDGKGCTGRYRDGTNVTLTARPGARSAFGGWRGCSPADSRTCTVPVNGKTTVNVTFDHVPDTTPPEVQLTGGGVTVTPNTGNRTVNRNGGSTTFSVTATGTDDGSDVTDTSVLFGFIHARCQTADGSNEELFIRESQFQPIRSDTDGSVGFTTDLDLCNSNFPVLLSAEGQFKGRATSEGGTATTDTLIVNYTP